MSEYIVSARKYRPATFNSVVGQRSLTDTLKQAIDSNRLAHAYLFCGPRGVGKTSCARIFAKTINCLSPTPDGEACGKCDACRAIDEGNSFNVIELDAASNNGVDDMRRLTEQVTIPPQVGKYRVFIIDEVHMLTSGAFNAFLKTLEEPPSYVVFILATTEKHKVIPTILSRCQIYDFKRITIQDIIDHLTYVASNEGITAEPSALGVIARKADGAMRDALSIFDQVAAYSRGNITYKNTIEHLNVLDYDYYFRLLDCFAAGDVNNALLIYKEIRDNGFDGQFFINGLASHLRDLMVAVDPSTIPLLEVGEDVAAKFASEALKVPVQWYFAALKILSDCDFNYRIASNKQLHVELALIRLCQLLNPSPIVPRDEPTKLKSLPSSPANPPVPRQQPSAVKAPASQSVSSHTVPKAETKREEPVSVAKPAASPKPAPAKAPAKAAVKAIKRPSTFRLTEEDDSPAQAAEPAAAQSYSQSQQEPSEFTEDQLSLAWNDFVALNPEKHIMVSAMRLSLPSKKEQGGKFEYEFVVENPAQQSAFETSLPELMTHLRSRLHCEPLTLSIRVNENKEENTSKILTDEQFLKKAVESNPVLAHLLSNIEAELA